MCKTVEYGFGVVLCYNAMTDLMLYTYPSQDDNKQERLNKTVYVTIYLTSVWRGFLQRKKSVAPNSRRHIVLF